MKLKHIAILSLFIGLATYSMAYGETGDSSPTPTLLVAGEEVPEVSVQTGNEGEGENAPERHQSKIPFGGWGGPMPLVMFPNMSSFSPLTDALGIGSFPDYMFLIGGMGSGQLGSHFRIGGGGAAGNIYTSGDVMGFNRSALISVGYGGMVLYGMLPINDKLEIYGRVLLGGGSFDVRVKGDDIAEEWEESQGFFAWNPAIGVACHPLRWMSMELEGGYFGMMLPEMHWLGQTVIKEGFAGGPTVQLNIQFGYLTRPKKGK